MNKISYIFALCLAMSASFVVGILYSEDVKSNISWIFDDGKKYQENYIDKNNKNSL
jgi:hypothetical protein